MKKSLLVVCSFVLIALCGAALRAQAVANVSGRYLDVKGQSMLEITRSDGGYRVTQVSTPVAKEQVNNGKVRAEIISAATNPLAGTVTDFASGKSYVATWDISDGGSTLTMKVKVGIFHASYVWKRAP